MSEENRNSNELATVSAPMVPAELQARIDRLWMDEKLDEMFMRKAEIMAQSRILPPIFQGDVYGCYSLQRIAFQWMTDPTLLAPGLYKVSPSSPLSLDGKTVKSIVDRFAPVKDHFINDEYFGDWDKILGKFETRQSKKLDDYGNPKTYKVPAWKPEDEQGLGIRLTATLSNGHDVAYELKLTQCLTRNSTLWAEDPMLQIYYRAIARFSRKYFPYILNGMYIKEEIQDHAIIDIREEEITPIPEPVKAPKTAKASPADKLKEKFNVLDNKGTISAQIAEIIEESGAPVDLDGVKRYLAGLGALNGYDIDELDKYPENLRNRMSSEDGLRALVYKAAEVSENLV